MTLKLVYEIRDTVERTYVRVTNYGIPLRLSLV